MCQIIQLYSCQHWVKSGTCTAQSSTSTPCLGYNSVTLIEKACPQCDSKKHPDESVGGEQLPTSGPPSEPNPNTNSLGEANRNVKLIDQGNVPRPVESGNKTRPAEPPERKQQDDTTASSERPSPAPEALKHRPTAGTVAGVGLETKKSEDRNDFGDNSSATHSGASSTSNREGKWPKMMSIISRKHSNPNDFLRATDPLSLRGHKLYKHGRSPSARQAEDERRARPTTVTTDSRSVSESPPRLPELGLSPLFSQPGNSAAVGNDLDASTHYLSHPSSPATSAFPLDTAPTYSLEPQAASLSAPEDSQSPPANSNASALPPPTPSTDDSGTLAQLRASPIVSNGPTETQDSPPVSASPPNLPIPSEESLLHPADARGSSPTLVTTEKSTHLTEGSPTSSVQWTAPESSTVGPEPHIAPEGLGPPIDAIDSPAKTIAAQEDNLNPAAELSDPTDSDILPEPNVPDVPDHASTESDAPAVQNDPAETTTSAEFKSSPDSLLPPEDPLVAPPDTLGPSPDTIIAPPDSLSALGLAVQRRWGSAEGSSRSASASAYSSTHASPRSLSPIPERASNSPPISPILASSRDLSPIAELPCESAALQSYNAASTTSSVEEAEPEPVETSSTEAPVQEVTVPREPSPPPQPKSPEPSITSVQSAATAIRRAKSPTNSLDAAAQRLDGVENGVNSSITYANGRFSASTQSLDAAIRRTISIAISEAVDPSPQSPTEEPTEDDRATSVKFAEKIEEIPEIQWQPNHPLTQLPQKPDSRENRKSWFRRGLLRSRSANEAPNPLPSQGWNVPLPPARRHEDFPTVPCNLPAKPPSIMRRTTEPLEPLHEVDEYHHGTSWMDRVPPDYVRRPNLAENDGRQSRAAMFGIPSIHSPKETDYDDDLTPSEDESDDEAAPPPIRRARSALGTSLDNTALTIINGEAHPGRKLSFPSVNGSPVNGHSVNGVGPSPMKKPPSRTPSSTSSIKAPSPLRHQIYPGGTNQPTWLETGSDIAASYLTAGVPEEKNPNRLAGPGVKVASRVVSAEDLAVKERREAMDSQEMQEDDQESVYSQEGLEDQPEQQQEEQAEEHSEELLIQRPDENVEKHSEEQPDAGPVKEPGEEPVALHEEAPAVLPPQPEEPKEVITEQQMEQQRKLLAQQEVEDEITPAPPKYQTVIPFVSPLVSAPEVPPRSTLRKVSQRQTGPGKPADSKKTKSITVQTEIHRIDSHTKMNGVSPTTLTKKRTKRERPYDPSERPREPLATPSEEDKPWHPPQTGSNAEQRDQTSVLAASQQKPEKKRRHTLFGRDSAEKPNKDRSASPQMTSSPSHSATHSMTHLPPNAFPPRRPSVAEKRSSRGFGKNMSNREKRDWIEVMAKDHEFGFL